VQAFQQKNERSEMLSQAK